MIYLGIGKGTERGKTQNIRRGKGGDCDRGQEREREREIERERGVERGRRGVKHKTSGEAE